MEREAILSGVGGQGVQLAANILAKAVIAEGKHIAMLSTYDGVMRGGRTASTIVFGLAKVMSPPVVSKAWSVLAMHGKYWPDIEAKVNVDGIVLYNSDLATELATVKARDVLPIAATAIANELGNETLATMVMVGAYARATGIVGCDSLFEAMRSLVPAYRQGQVSANLQALSAGYAAVPQITNVWVDEGSRT